MKTKKQYRKEVSTRIVEWQIIFLCIMHIFVDHNFISEKSMSIQIQMLNKTEKNIKTKLNKTKQTA